MPDGPRGNGGGGSISVTGDRGSRLTLYAFQRQHLWEKSWVDGGTLCNTFQLRPEPFPASCSLVCCGRFAAGGLFEPHRQHAETSNPSSLKLNLKLTFPTLVLWVGGRLSVSLLQVHYRAVVMAPAGSWGAEDLCWT